MAQVLGRTPGSVAMKLNNLTSLDPDELARGVKGLAGASQLDRQVWQEFHQDWQRLALESEALRESMCPDQKSAPNDATPAPANQTEAEREIKVRLAQGFFRRVVLSAYQAQCCVTGNPIAEFLVASHILPWASHPNQRINPRNGLCLSRLHDVAFDQGLIAFDDDYRLILSKRLKDHFSNQNIRDNFAGFEGKPLKMPQRFYPEKSFLAGHRESVYQP